MPKGLEHLFNPKSIAVVGVSDKPGKLSAIIMESLAESGFPGMVYPVNPRHTTVGGQRCYQSIEAIGADIDLAILAVPASEVIPILRNAEGTVKSAVVISGGFAESGAQGTVAEKELAAIARKSGLRIIGPNCMGIFDTISKVDTFFIPGSRIRRPARGGLSIISQSGSFAATALDELACEGIGVARVISYGNMCDVNESDCLDFLAEDVHTSAVALYIESVGDGRRFVEAASRCSSKKPVLAVKVGRRDSGASAARSHTGALAGRYEAYKAAFRKAGVIELEGYEDFMCGCKAFGRGTSAKGNRVVIITDGGGIGVNLADLCETAGLVVVPVPDNVRERLASVFPPYFSIGNPMDLTGSATDDMFADALDASFSGDSFDIAIVAVLWGPPGLTDDLPEMLAQKAMLFGSKPMIICSPGGDYARGRAGLFRRHGHTVFATPEGAVRAASILARSSGMAKRRVKKDG